MKWTRIAGLLVALAVSQVAQAQTATVTWTNLHQTIDGFGVSSWNASAISDAQADLFFSPTKGIGLSLVRPITNVNGNIPDLVTLQKAMARGAKVWLTSQGPPASMKDNGSYTNAGSLLPGSYSSYAAYLTTYVQLYQTNGISLYAISIQDEPDVNQSTLGACLWTGSQFQNFIKNNLGPTFATAGLTTKIMAPEQAEWFQNDLAAATLNDPAAAQYVGIIAGHGYSWSGEDKTTDGTGRGACCHTATPYPLAQSKGKKLWLTETGTGGGSNSYDGSISDGVTMAHTIHDFLTVADVNAWNYWMMFGNSWSNDNEGLTDVNGNAAKRLYTFGNFSRFIRPGWVRIDASGNPQGGVYVSAYKDPVSGEFAIVAINRNGNGVTQNIALSGFDTATVTPWVTSAGLNLVQQTDVSVSNQSFGYALPALSVTTFVGTMNAGGAANRPNAPGGLSATVH